MVLEKKQKKLFITIAYIYLFIISTTPAKSDHISFDRSFYEADEPIYEDLHINPRALGMPGYYLHNYHKEKIPNIQHFVNKLRERYGKAEIIKNKLINQNYQVIEVQIIKTALTNKAILIVDHENIIVGYCFFDWPFIINKNHVASPMQKIELMGIDSTLGMQIKRISNTDTNLRAYSSNNNNYIERFGVSFMPIKQNNSSDPSTTNAYFILQEAYYPSELDNYIIEESQVMLPKMLADFSKDIF